MNTYKLCFKAGDILNGSVPLQFIIGLADSLADQVSSPSIDHHRITPPPPPKTINEFQHPLTINKLLQPTDEKARRGIRNLSTA